MSGSTFSLQTPPSPMMRSSSALRPDPHTPSRSTSPGAASIDSFRSSPGELSPPLGSRTPIPVSGTDSAFFKSLLDFFYTASTPLGEVFTFLFEDSSYVDKGDALDRLSQVNHCDPSLHVLISPCANSTAIIVGPTFHVEEQALCRHAYTVIGDSRSYT